MTSYPVLLWLIFLASTLYFCLVFPKDPSFRLFYIHGYIVDYCLLQMSYTWIHCRLLSPAEIDIYNFLNKWNIFGQMHKSLFNFFLGTAFTNKHIYIFFCNCSAC